MNRYAIYFLPDGALGRAGAEWLGRDCLTGLPEVQPDCAGIAGAVFRSRTAQPSRYGFHATLKAPMVLADGVDEDALIARGEAFAACHGPLSLGGLSPSWIGDFLALTPDAPSDALTQFAFDVVRYFEPVRAALDAEEFARRTKGLPDTLVRHVEQWGYPYVADAFCFHITLSAPIDEGDKLIWKAAAQAWFGAALSAPVMIDSVSLAVETDSPGAFRELRRLPLKG